MLTFNLAHLDDIDQPYGSNRGWLDFSHGLTFADAVYSLCTRYPELWPAGLLQMACFAGRNAGYADPDIRLEDWVVSEPQNFSRNNSDADGPRTIRVHSFSSFAQDCSSCETTFIFAADWCGQRNRAGGIKPVSLVFVSEKDGEADSPSSDALYSSGPIKYCQSECPVLFTFRCQTF
ncbi:MAG: hypothetical protein Ct9H300mP14_08400 [Gammaproteobacteria bacterium]|nr:MAG: hypothetical protein Ct9H300mP14_08400 [Gammaproteobacteria bacterium]